MSGIADILLALLKQSGSEEPVRRPAGLLRLGAETALSAYPKPFQNTPESNQAAIDAAANFGPGILGKIVWHGSPHKFDRFDASKIGTGEGAQAYGHGVYLADAEDVAKSYVDPLYKARDATQIGGLAYDDFLNKSRESVPTSTRDRALFSKALAPAKSQEEAAANLAELKKLRPEYDFQKVDALFSLAFKSGVSFPQKGALYKADLPDEWIPKMLEWDKPLSQQPKTVRDALEPFVAPIRKEMAKPADKAWGDLAAPQKYDPTGAELLSLFRNEKAGAQNILSNGLGPDVSARLREAGIPGIRYLDGGSRSAGQGSYNYVVFPGLEDQVKILERNGQPLGLLGVGGLK